MIDVRPRSLFIGVVLAVASLAAWSADEGGLTAFHAECGKAMDVMMTAMDAPGTGDIDADFSQMMIPHHQGAIDMAVAELRYGKNEQLRRVAQEIIVDQRQEIDAMRMALGRPPLPSSAAPTSPRPDSLPKEH
jgi:uncharacterized protein (DUF305 family)